MTQFRIAIAGIGAVAEMHATSVGDIDYATLVAGSCRTESKGRAFADNYGCDWFSDTESMLDGAEPDVLIVCTPSGAHLGPTRAAAERGIDVLCEKPLEITSERIDEMSAVAEANEISLGGVFHQRFNPVMKALYRAASAGRFGPLSTINTYVPWWRDDEYYEGAWQGTWTLDGGGAVMNQSIHGIDAIQWLASANTDIDDGTNMVEEVFAYTAVRGCNESVLEAEDTAVVALKYRNGALGQILGATSMYPGSLKRVQIAGRDGTAEILEDELVTWRFRDDEPSDETVRNRFSETTTGGGAADPMDLDYANHRRNLRAFLDSLANDEPFVLDVTEARKAVEIIEAIYESAERGVAVRLPH